MAAVVDEPWPGSTDGTTIEDMPVVKRSISLSTSVVERIEKAAAEDGLSFSAWIDKRLDHDLRIREGRKAVAEYEAEHGAFTAEERAEARRTLDRLLGRAEAEPGRREKS